MNMYELQSTNEIHYLVLSIHNSTSCTHRSTLRRCTITVYNI